MKRVAYFLVALYLIFISVQVQVFAAEISGTEKGAETVSQSGIQISDADIDALKESNEIIKTNEILADLQDDSEILDKEIELYPEGTGGVKSKLDSVLSNYPVGSTWNGSWGGASQCFGFARMIFSKVFGCEMPTAYKGSYRYIYSTSTNVTLVGRLEGSNVTAAKLKSIFSNAKVGDIIQGCGGTYGQHTMILYSVTSSGITFYDCNSGGNNQIKYGSRTWASLASRYSGYSSSYGNNGISIYRANNYATVDYVAEQPTDTTPPSISNVYITNCNNTGYNVNCTVTDNVRITDIQLPTWTDYGAQDDIRWEKVVSSGNSNRYVISYRINISDHNNEGGWYNTHIYAWDSSGNKTCVGVRSYVDIEPPVISNIQVTNVGIDGYTVSCTVTDNCGVDRVQFPSWTTYNDQDDITPEWWVNSVATGSRNGNVFSYRVTRDKHNYEINGYMTHIYAYDSAGNKSYVSAVENMPLAGYPQDIGEEFQSTIQNIKTGNYLTQEDTGNIASYNKMNIDAQEWKFKRLSDGSYQILCLRNDYSLDCWGAAENETNVASSPYHGRDNQRWYLYGNEKEGYYIVPKNSVSCCISLHYGSSANGTNIKMYNIYNSTDQRFRIEGTKANKPDTSESGSSIDDSQSNGGGNSNTADGIDDTTQMPIKSFVKRMYTVALNRQAEENGLIYWTEKLDSLEIDGAGIANGFINSQEFKTRNLNDSDYLEVLYMTFFGRNADIEGKKYWLNHLTNGTSRTEVLSGFVNSQEFSEICDQYGIARGTMQTDGTSIYKPGVRNYVLRMYTKALNRNGETVGVEEWTNRINTKIMSPETVAKSFFNSQEFINRNLNNADYVETLYQTFMDRASDASGKQYWIDQLNNGMSRQQVLEGFSRSVEFSEIMRKYGL